MSFPQGELGWVLGEGRGEEGRERERRDERDASESGLTVPSLLSSLHPYRGQVCLVRAPHVRTDMGVGGKHLSFLGYIFFFRLPVSTKSRLVFVLKLPFSLLQDTPMDHAVSIPTNLLLS